MQNSFIRNKLQLLESNQYRGMPEKAIPDEGTNVQYQGMQNNPNDFAGPQKDCYGQNVYNNSLAKNFQ